MSDLPRLSRRLGYTFTDEALLVEALSHRSSGNRNYERLEFLGDSLLNFVIADALFTSNPQLDEGSLSRLRSSLVRGSSLAEIARELELGSYLLLGTGELRSGGFNRDSILADVVESILGAAYVEAGFTVAQGIVLRLFHNRLRSLPSAEELKDPKTRLQELLQGQGMERPGYAVVNTSGESHRLEFTVSCTVNSHNLTVKAVASSRRKAEQAAASTMLDKIREESSTS